MEVDGTHTLLQVAESPRVGDWTLRSALVRFAQQQPELAGAILESVRRTQAALDPLAKKLMRHGVSTDRRLSLTSDGGLGPVTDPLPDVRVADLARLVRILGPAGNAVVEAYDAQAEVTLDPAEREAVALLVVMLDLDDLAETLAGWAPNAPANPPVEAARRLGRSAFDRLDALGVAREQRQRPPGGGRSSAASGT